MKVSKSFLVFLVISVFIWLIMNMSRTYIQDMVIDLEYVDLPQNKTYNIPPKGSLSIEVKGSGFSLFSAKFSQKKVNVSLKNIIHQEGNWYYLSSSLLSRQIQKQLSKGLVVKDVGDRLAFSLGTLKTKKVQIIPDLSLNYKLGFDSTEIQLAPDSIYISGTQINLDKINAVKLAHQTINDVSENINRKVPIVFPSKIKSNLKEVMVTVKVDKFTEGQFELPIEIKNLGDENITTYPNKVKVFFKVALQNFNKITPDLFHVEADYKFSKDNGLSYLSLQLKKKPNIISKVRIVPEKIDFLIVK